MRCNIHRGNVSKSTKVTDTIACPSTTIEWEVKGANTLTPDDARKMKLVCLGKQDPHHLSFFVQSLTAIRLFMKNMEFLDLSAENFDQDIFMFIG